MWDIYCSICGVSFVEPSEVDVKKEFKGKDAPNYNWWENVKMVKKTGIWTYDMYGRFYIGDETDPIDEIEIDDRVCQCVHDECWKLNGKSFKGVRYETEDDVIVNYHGQFFEYVSCLEDGNGWMLENPVTNERNKTYFVIDV